MRGVRVGALARSRRGRDIRMFGQRLGSGGPVGKIESWWRVRQKSKEVKRCSISYSGGSRSGVIGWPYCFYAWDARETSYDN